MDRKTEILLATLELAAANGLSNVSMAQIAEKIGIKKPSLYNHFQSRDEIITAMYEFFRTGAKNSLSTADVDYGELAKNRSAGELLSMCVSNYFDMSTNENMLLFYKVIYSERATNPEAARIMAEETKKMLIATKNLFYALKVHGKISVDDIDTAATAFAMTIHAMMDYQLDCTSSGMGVPQDMIDNYIKWYTDQLGGK